MAELKQWCRIISVTVIFSGILISVLPEAKLKNTYKGFVSVILIFVFLSQMSDVEDMFKITGSIIYNSEYSEEELSEKNSTIVLDCAENLLEERLNASITEVNSGCHCDAFLSESNGQAYIEKIKVFGYLSNEDEKEIDAIISEMTGGDTEIEFIG